MAIKRKMTIEVSSDGPMDVYHKSGIRGTVALVSGGSWVWNIWDTPTASKSCKFGGSGSQFEAYGELILEMWSMTT